MPTTVPPVFPRWPQQFQNGTNTAPPQATSDPGNGDSGDDQKEPTQTPSSIPEPVYSSVTVLPAEQIAEPTTKHNPIPTYAGSGATILGGYCTEPAYTILDGPTAVWVPVVGCISSKADCCPTTSGGSGAAPTGKGEGEVGGAGKAQFPISSMPVQGTLTGCPKDYHTVGGTACCPSSYWLWSTELGGQVPCYSSLKVAMVPPPMPDTLAHPTITSDASSGASSGAGSTASTTVPALTMSDKPTSAIVNIAYAMQYAMVPAPKPAMKKEAKIGIGVGVTGAAVIMVVVLWFIIRKFLGRSKSQKAVRGESLSVNQRFGEGVDMSRVAHEPPPMSRSYGGATYSGVATRGNEY